VKDGPSTPNPELLGRLLRGDAAAWGDLVGEYSGFLLAASRKTFASYGAAVSSQDCEDAVADVWKNLVENDCKLVRDCIARGNFLQTLQVLARNRSVDILRRRPHIGGRGQAELLDSVTPAAPPVQHDGPEVEPEALAAAMQRLTPRERTLINLFFLQRRKYHQIAGLTGIPQNSIGPTLARALAKLRRDLADD
jgi:RNA polymerase sigma-70 factor, ECF subfamily